MRVVQDGLEFCSDCLIVCVNGDTSGVDTDERVQQICDGLDDLSDTGSLVPDFDSDTGRGIWEFKTTPCDCCGTKLYGSRHAFALLGEGGDDEVS